MKFRQAAVSFFLRTVLNSICKIDCREFVQALEKNKPLIVIFNHINFLEVPILVSHSYPIKVTGLVKSETWKNPFFAFLLNTFKGIPINREGAFAESFKHVQEAINSGFYVCISPEGTRSKNGILGKGKAGVIQLAIDAGIPVLPVAHYGGENFWRNIKRFKRTTVCFKAGRPFRIKVEKRPGREEREEIINEVMGQIAYLLPQEKRGIYAGMIENECKHLDFI